MVLIKLLGVISLFFCAHSYAQQEITIGLAGGLPPYVISAESGTGIELDVVKGAFAQQGISVNFEFMRSAYLAKALTNKDVSAIVALTSLPVESSERAFYESEPITEFQNVAIALKNKQYSINNIQDLTGKRIAAFRGAKRWLGPEFNLAVSANAYVEQKAQITLVKLLVGGRYDLVIADRRMFNYWFGQVQQNNQLPKSNSAVEFDYFPILAATPRTLRFNDRALRDIFNRGLASIDTNKIEGKY